MAIDPETPSRHRSSEMFRVDLPARRQKGGVHPAWQQKAAKGPVPKAARVKQCLKGSGELRPKEKNVTGGAVYVVNPRTATPTLRGKKTGEGAPRVQRGKRGVLSDEWLYADMPSQRPGIRVAVPKPADPAIRERQLMNSRHAKQAAYVLQTPYAKKGETENLSYRRSRRAVTPSPARSDRSVDSIVGLMGVTPSPVRQRGKNLACKPLDVGVFDKTPTSERRSKYIDPHRNTNTSSSKLFDRPERIFLPTNYREKGTLSSSKEGAEGCLARGAGKARPAESLVSAWNIAEEAPSERASCTRQRSTPSSVVPWGIHKKLSLTRYHRRKSIEASVRYLKKKSARTNRAHTPVPGQHRENEFVRSSTAGSLASFCGSENASLVSPRGKRIWPQATNSVILDWH